MLSIYQKDAATITISGSRFIAVIFPLFNKNDISRYLEEVEKEYPKATHYCYAYRFEKEEYSYDDGEPSHSAGLPILNALKSEELEECLLVVTRYFGGTKLGLPRLTKAYKDISKDVASKAIKATLCQGKKVHLSVDYSSFEYIKRLSSKNGFDISLPLFDTKVTFFCIGSDNIIMPLLEKLQKEEILSIEDTVIRRRLDYDSCK